MCSIVTLAVNFVDNVFDMKQKIGHRHVKVNAQEPIVDHAVDVDDVAFVEIFLVENVRDVLFDLNGKAICVARRSFVQNAAVCRHRAVAQHCRRATNAARQIICPKMLELALFRVAIF